MSLIPSGDWYDSLIEDVKAIMVEGLYNAKQIQIETYHAVGGRIVNDPEWQKHNRGNGETLQTLSKFTGIHKRDLYRAIAFYETYPKEEDWKSLPEGKNISWNKIVTNYLPKGDKPKDETVKTYKVIKAYHSPAWCVLLPIGTLLHYWEERGFYVTEPVNNICAAVSKWAVEAWHDYFEPTEPQ